MAKTKTIENLFNYLAFYSDLLPVFFFFLFYSKSKSQKGLWIILAYCIYDFLTNLGLLYLSQKHINRFLYSSFTFIEFSLFAWVLFTIIKNQRFKKVLMALSVAFIVFLFAYNMLTKVNAFDSIPIGIETILILVFSFYYLFEQINDTSTLFIYSKFSFWVILGILLYLAGSFFIYIFSNQLLSEHRDEEVAKYWMITNVFSILKNIFFVIAIMVNTNRPPKKNIGFALYNLN